MSNWGSILTYDAITALLSSENKAVAYFAGRDLLENAADSPESLWELPEVQSIIRKQQQNGSWKYPAGNTKIRSFENYDQIETYRNLGYLIESYGLNKNHPAIPKAANFLFQFQSSEGDIRGILGNQYSPYYTAGMLELLIKAGYSRDEHILKAFKWLKAIRQDDGGWAMPLRTRDEGLRIISTRAKTLEPDRTKPYSHMVTGIVLRAYAAHEQYRKLPEARDAGKLLLSSFFKKDNYTDRSSPDFWLKFTYPFWFTDLISALDSLSILGFSRDEPQIEKAIVWLLSHQEENGLWKLKTLKNKKIYGTELWLSLAICRIIKRLYEPHP